MTTPNSSNSGDLLRDIEQISKALYLHKASPKSLLPPNPNPNPDTSSLRSKKSMWSWKKPLKALTHIGSRKFSCCFYLHVHSVENLPETFNGVDLRVHWARKDDVIAHTSFSRVEEVTAEFDESLMQRCSLYGSRNGANHAVKYNEKLCVVYISAKNDSGGDDFGKHWVDLTRLLPLTFEELEGEKRFGKWSTSFAMKGKAEGGWLNVSLGFSVMQDSNSNNGVSLSKDPNVLPVVSDVPKRAISLDTGVRQLWRVGSVSSSGNYRPRQSVDYKAPREVVLSGGLELAKSIDVLCQRLDEGKLCKVVESESEDVRSQLELESVSTKGVEEDEDDEDVEFTVVEVGTELPEKEKLNADDKDSDDGNDNDKFAIENNVDDVIKDYDTELDEKTMIDPKDVCGDYVVDSTVSTVDDIKREDDSVCTKGSKMNEVESASESAELNFSFSRDECFEELSYMELKSTYMASKTGRKSVSLDDVTESVSNEFLNMLEMDGYVCSGSDPESPRELLLREFEEEAMTSGEVFLNFDWNEEQPGVETSVPPVSDYEDFLGYSDLSMIIQAAEEENHRESELLKRRKAKILEGLETEALLREWGLNEKDFRNSPRTLSGGFGSPIDLPFEEPVLPSLEVGFGPYVRLKGGGFLQSMNPSIFRNAKNGGTLVIQYSDPKVIPAKMGYDVLEILQHMALVGINKLNSHLNKLMPLENITGKTIHQVAGEAQPTSMVSDRSEQILDEASKDDGFPSSWNCNDLRSKLVGREMASDYASLECLVPLAINKIEGLSLEGLRIQSCMSDSEAPSSIYPRSDFRHSDDNVDKLMDLSLSLKEWSRLDSRLIADDNQSRENLSNILAAHDATHTDLVGGSLIEDRSCTDVSGRNRGLLGNNLTIALMVQLRDPSRDYEPVGLPMLALIQVERVLSHSIQEISGMVLNSSKDNDHNGTIFEIDDQETEKKRGNQEMTGPEERDPQFKIIDVHLAGVGTESGSEQRWGTTTQLQSGSRWLLAAGLGKSISVPLSKSKALIVRSSTSAKLQHRDNFWSITSTSHAHDTRASWKDLIAPHIRNPSVIFSSEVIKPQ